MKEVILAIVIPTLAVFIAYLLNRSDSNGIRVEISQLRNEMIAARAETHADILHILSIHREQEGRISRLEARS